MTSTTAPRTRRLTSRRVTMLLLLVASLNLAVVSQLVPGGEGHQVTAQAAETAAVTSASSTHPFSDPLWFPLRNPARIGCAKSGCGTKDDYGYWAIVFTGNPGDPIYPAGAGIAHIGAISYGCSAVKDGAHAGTWVWVDHGGGVVTRYYHLSAVAITDGEHVTPSTRLGTMGHSGDVKPCNITYLHFEVRAKGVFGPRSPFYTLTGCENGQTVKLPEVFGATDWNDPKLHPKNRLVTPTLDQSCIPATPATPAALTPTLKKAKSKLTVPSAAAAGSTSWMAHLQQWHPTIHRWGSDVYTTAAPGKTITFKGLDTKRKFRVETASHNAAGWSAWSKHVKS